MKINRFLVLLSLVLCYGCKPNVDTLPYVKVMGQTMGTYYSVTCQSSDPTELKKDIESLLKEVNDGMNHYLPNSLITQFNNAEKGHTFEIVYGEGLRNNPADHFYKNIAASRRIVKETHEHFDPTVGPLVNYWKFGSTGKYSLTKIDSTKIDSLLEVISFHRIILKKDEHSFTIDKSDPRVALDFSAIAKGYGVDAIGDLLDANGIGNYFIDIGGEVKVTGVNNKGMNWTLGINQPEEGAAISALAKIISITDKAIATSGNYRNVYEIDGVKVSHTINPFSGYPERSNLLSATIIHDECMYADAYATACMVMGLEKALQFVNTHPEISYLFLYSNDDGEIGSKDSGDLTFLE